MQTHRRIVIATIFLVLALGAWNWRPFTDQDEIAPSALTNRLAPPPESQAPPSSEPPLNKRQSDSGSQHKITLLPATALTSELHSPETNGEDDLHLLDALFIAFRQATNGNPTGENYEIVAALTGQNAKHVAVIPPNHPAITLDGVLQDRWGSPYFFHSISADRMEIRSAGPDKKLWSDDDILTEKYGPAP